MKRAAGFTLIELLVVMAIIALLVSILMPMLGQARELARRTKCSGNLRAIAQGLSLYTETYKTSPHLGYRYRQSYDEFGDDPDGRYSSLSALFENGTGSNFQHWWLLVREKVTEEQSFACPSDGSYKEPVEETGYGWESRYNVSYGLQPASPARGLNPGYPGAPGQDSSTFVIGDKPQTHMYGWEDYSANHPDSGTNLASLSGTVIFHNAKGWRKCIADYDRKNNERVKDNFWRPGNYGSFGSSTFPWYPDDTYLYWDEFY